MENLSAASKRAQNYSRSSEWYCGFAYTPIKGLGLEVGVHRRDPSSVLLHDGVFYVYYTKSVGPYFGMSSIGVSNKEIKLYPWDQADIYYATSSNGINWSEQGPAVTRGEPGDIDDRTICTPDILEHEGHFYLVYQAQSNDVVYSAETESVGMAVSTSPSGPFEKVKGSIFERKEQGNWFTEQEPDNYNYGTFVGLVHDPSLYFYNDQFWLYYKCGYGRADKVLNDIGHKNGGPDTRWGVAVSDAPTGPFKPHAANPVTNSGHETMLWNYKDGICALLNRDGPEQDTIQYAKDGVNFEIMARINNTPQAGGAFRSKNNDVHPLEGIRWGLCHVDERGSQWNHIVRFDCDPRFSYKINHNYSNINNTTIF